MTTAEWIKDHWLWLSGAAGIAGAGVKWFWDTFVSAKRLEAEISDRLLDRMSSEIDKVDARLSTLQDRNEALEARVADLRREVDAARAGQQSALLQARKWHDEAQRWRSAYISIHAEVEQLKAQVEILTARHGDENEITDAVFAFRNTIR